MDKRLIHSAQMGADKLAENTPNTPKYIAHFVCSSQKVCDFHEKRLHRASVVRVSEVVKHPSTELCCDFR